MLARTFGGPSSLAGSVVGAPALSFYALRSDDPRAREGASAFGVVIGRASGLTSAVDILGELPREQHALARIRALESETNRANWDDEQGQPIAPAVWNEVRRVVTRIARELSGVPAPFVSACGDGFVHLTWTTSAGNRGVLEIGADATWWSYVPISPRFGVDQVEQLRAPEQAFAKLVALFG